jgi:hypothetical protein
VSLIEELYDEKSRKLIKSLYKDDVNSRETLYAAFAEKILEKSDLILTSKPLDILTLLCMTANFADTKEECQQVAIIVFKCLKQENPLPYIMDDQGFALAEKTLVALSFFRSAMDYRSKRKGAPTSDFYRRTSKIIFEQNGYPEISAHHEQWEKFLNEMFL